ncbi:MAG: D-alanyl-D-alanine carboxypeptidase [Firmicutes bacterium]|nr:D-alanyl-D-alanine carboxypeptidase [Bacillota bacterium]
MLVLIKNRWSPIIAFTMVLVLLLGLPAQAAFESAAEAAVLQDYFTGNVLYEKNAAQAKPPASITKLMTLLLAFEALEDGDVTWETPLTVSEAAWRMGGSQMFLEIGQEVTFRDLITGISVVSANDACVVVAEHLAGSEGAFVGVMNERAGQLGLQHTTFKNATGLPAEGHVMSPMDIVVLSRHLLTNYPGVLEFESQREFTYNGIRQYNRNPLIGRYEGADGLKTGWTEEAGFCLAATAQREGLRLIGVILNTPSEKERLTAAEELLDYGFANFRLYEIPEGEVIGDVPVDKGRKLSVPVKTASRMALAIERRRMAELEQEVIAVGDVRAPIKVGDPLGRLQIKQAGQVLAETELVAAEDVARANILLRFFRWLLSLIKIRPA